MEITDFKQLETNLKSRNSRKNIAVVMATDATTRGAMARALEEGIADMIFVGARAEVEADDTVMRHSAHVSIVDADNADDAAAKAVALAREGKADVIMKGLINTDNLLKAVLNKETGILAKGEVLTHITVVQMPTYHKLLMVSDVAVIPYPTSEQRMAQVRYIVDFAHEIGIECPKVALTHCSEKVDERHFPFTADYVTVRDKAAAGDFGKCIVDGPLDVKTSCSKAALDKKGIISPIEGDADALIFADIEAGNCFYKTVTLFAGATVAGLLCGCSTPVVIPSRGDSLDSKYNSLVVASLCGRQL